MAEYDEVEFTKLDAPLQNELRKELGDELRNFFPHGHPAFIELALKELDLHSRKNYDYSFGGDSLGNFKRVATILKLYPGLSLTRPVVIALTYMAKQLDAVMWILSTGHKTKIEGISDRIRDISVYAKLMEILLNEEEMAHTDDQG